MRYDMKAFPTALSVRILSPDHCRILSTTSYAPWHPGLYTLRVGHSCLQRMRIELVRDGRRTINASSDHDAS